MLLSSTLRISRGREMWSKAFIPSLKSLHSLAKFSGNGVSQSSFNSSLHVLARISLPTSTVGEIKPAGSHTLANCVRTVRRVSTLLSSMASENEKEAAEKKIDDIFDDVDVKVLFIQVGGSQGEQLSGIVKEWNCGRSNKGEWNCFLIDLFNLQ